MITHCADCNKKFDKPKLSDILCRECEASYLSYADYLDQVILAMQLGVLPTGVEHAPRYKAVRTNASD